MISSAKAKELRDGVKANDYILNCLMRPMKRLGIDTVELHVFSHSRSQPLIGYYDPINSIFRPIDNYLNRFSKELIYKIIE